MAFTFLELMEIDPSETRTAEEWIVAVMEHAGYETTLTRKGDEIVVYEFRKEGG